MKTDAELIYDIIFPRADYHLLDGYYLGIFNGDKSKFFAFTYVKIDKELYRNVSFQLEQFGGYSSYSDQEKMKKNITANSWQSKSREECIDEGLFTHYAIKYIGMKYEGEWHVTSDLAYFGSEINEEQAKKNFTFQWISG